MPRTHEKTYTSEYRTWCHMKIRCNNTNHNQYKDYGGRGIKLCERWEHSFENFLADMGIKPFPSYQIDRTDNDGNYEPDNCRWVTLTENIRNRPSTKLSMSKARAIREEIKTFKSSELAIIYGVHKTTINRIVRNEYYKEDGK